jgi:hypothetical protein
VPTTPYSSRKISTIHFCQRLSRPQGCSADKRTRLIEKKIYGEFTLKKEGLEISQDNRRKIKETQNINVDNTGNLTPKMHLNPTSILHSPFVDTTKEKQYDDDDNNNNNSNNNNNNNSIALFRERSLPA